MLVVIVGSIVPVSNLSVQCLLRVEGILSEDDSRSLSSFIESPFSLIPATTVAVATTVARRAPLAILDSELSGTKNKYVL